MALYTHYYQPDATGWGRKLGRLRRDSTLAAGEPEAQKRGWKEPLGPVALLKTRQLGPGRVSEPCSAQPNYPITTKSQESKGSRSKTQALAFRVGRMASENKEGTGAGDAQGTSSEK